MCFWHFGCEACGVSGPQPETTPEGRVTTSGPPGKCLSLYFEYFFFGGEPSLILCSLQYLPQTCLNIKNEIQNLGIKEIDE